MRFWAPRTPFPWAPSWGPRHAQICPTLWRALRALTTSHSLAMPVCLWSEMHVSGSGRHFPAQIQYHWYFSHQSFNQPLLQPFLSEQMWHFHRLTTAVIAWGLWGQSWVNLNCLAWQLCRNKFQFQTFILLIYSLSCHCSQAQLYHRSHV